MNDRPFDLDAVARDDHLLDLLAAGVRPDDSDPVIQALHTWRNDLTAGVGAPPALSGNALPDVPPAPATDVTTVGGTSSNGKVNGVARVNGHAVGVARVNGATRPTGRGPAGRQAEEPAEEPRRPARRRAAVAAVVVGLSAGLGGVAVAAADAGPGSPLWPIAKVIYADSAADRQHEADAEMALAKARKALADGRVAEAERYLDEAGRHAASSDSQSADELRDEVSAVREQLQEQETDSNDGGGTPSGDPSPSAEPSESGDDSAPVATPELPTPGTPAGGGSGAGPNRDGKDYRNDDKDQPKSTSSDLELEYPDQTGIPRSLPEF